MFSNTLTTAIAAVEQGAAADASTWDKIRTAWWCSESRHESSAWPGRAAELDRWAAS
jgi:hypothetical protein